MAGRFATGGWELTRRSGKRDGQKGFSGGKRLKKWREGTTSRDKTRSISSFKRSATKRGELTEKRDIYPREPKFSANVSRLPEEKQKKK